ASSIFRKCPYTYCACYKRYKRIVCKTSIKQIIIMIISQVVAFINLLEMVCFIKSKPFRAT
ncbi:hypothetical protein, partial [uncultured Parvimonas sp.]